MADKRISQLIERVDIANNDVLPIVASGATTTNKVTISTIQEWMQDNLDVGVTSVGITIGSSGTDVNVTGSPITTSGNITINIPTASATNRGLLSSADWSTFNGKQNSITLTTSGTSGAATLVGSTLNIPNYSTGVANAYVPYVGAIGSVTLGYNALSASQINIDGNSPTGGSYLGFKHATSVNTGTDGYTSMYTFGTNTIGFQSTSGGSIKTFSFSMVGITPNVAGGRVYTLPDASGTLALTSQLDGYVTLNTAQTITAQKTFTTSGSSDTMIISHGSGSGIALDVIKAGNSEAIRVTKTSGSGNAVTITGGLLSAEAGTFSGELQSNTRVAASTGGQSIILTANSGGTTNRIEGSAGLPMHIVTSGSSLAFAAGGTTPQITLASSGAVTLTGALNGTSASFTGNVTSTGGNFRLFNGYYITAKRADGVDINVLGFPAGSNNLTSVTPNDYNLQNTGGQNLFSVASTGAATFSSTITSGDITTNGNNKGLYFNGTRNAILGNASLEEVYIATANATRLTIASTGAATFSSSVTTLGSVDITGEGNTLTLRKSNNSPALTFIGASSNTIIEGGNTFNLYTGGAGNRIFVTSTGNVGIGTASPQRRVDIFTTATSATEYQLSLRNGAGANNVSAGLAFGFNSASADPDYLSAISSIITNRSTRAADLTFLVVETADTGSLVERMRITSGGFLKASNTGSYQGSTQTYHELRTDRSNENVAIFSNTSSSPYGPFIVFPNASPNNTVNYFLSGGDSTNDRFYIYSNGNMVNRNGSYGSFSDVKLKENIEDATPKLDDLMKVKVRNYNLIGDDKKQIGVIAQELEEVFPAMIDESEDFEDVEVPQVDEEGNEVLNEEGEVVTEKQRVSKGTTTKSVKYSVFVPMLIKAMQEQQEQIKSLTEQVEALKSQING